MKTSEKIKARCKEQQVSFFANDNISSILLPGEVDLLQQEVESHMTEVLKSLVIDIENDHNTKETAKRVAKMYLKEVFKGRYEPKPNVTDFPNAKNLDELYVLGPITFRSACSHHLVPIMGKVWVGVHPSDKVIGISKFNRLITDWLGPRPHIQEEAAIMIADELEKTMNPIGLGVVVKAQHLCMTWRGVKETETEMTNSIMRGTFRTQPEVRKEFFDLIKAHGFQ